MSGATLYIEPQPTINLNNQLRQLQRQEEAEEEAVRQALTEQVAAVKATWNGCLRSQPPSISPPLAPAIVSG